MSTMLITGAAHGIGAAIARAAASTYKLILLDLDQAALTTVADELSAQAFCVDVTDHSAVAQTLQDIGQIDVLINNAGILRTGPLIDHAPEDFELVLRVNLHAVFVMAQAVARKMRDQNGGVIINMSSINAIHPSPNCGAYVAAKAGVQALTQQMSIEWGELGIRVNAVAPGFVDAGMSTPFYADPKVRNARAAAVPSGRLGTAEDIANVVLFLASSQADYINGQTLTVDGGVINSVLKHLPRE